MKSPPCALSARCRRGVGAIAGNACAASVSVRARSAAVPQPFRRVPQAEAPPVARPHRNAYVSDHHGAHTMSTSPNRLDAYRLRRVAVAADVDPRTVARVVAGARVQRVTRSRVIEALRAEGLSDFIPNEAAAA